MRRAVFQPVVGRVLECLPADLHIHERPVELHLVRVRLQAGAVESVSAYIGASVGDREGVSRPTALWIDELSLKAATVDTLHSPTFKIARSEGDLEDIAQAHLDGVVKA
jgi:hypothetical protein